MSVDRTEGRRTNHRAFRPTLNRDGGLEPRLLMSHVPNSFLLKHPKPGVAYVHNQPPFRNGTHAKPFEVTQFPDGTHVQTEVAHGGQSVRVFTPDGSGFLLSLTYYTPPASTTTGVTNLQPPIQGQTPGNGPIQPQGTIRAYPMSGGRVGLILDGTTSNTELTISPYPKFQRKGYAHSFSYGMTNRSEMLNIGQITVNSGIIAAIEGFHTADLSGPLTILGTTAVDRLAFESLRPGASIQTGGDLNTLDVQNGVNLNSGHGLIIGRDLNLFNVGQDVNLSNGASLRVGRFLGLITQAPKGTATGSNFLSQNQSQIGSGTSTLVPGLSGYIQGNFSLGAGSVFQVVQGIAESSIVQNGASTSSAPTLFLINGAFSTPSASQLQIPNILPGTTITTTTTAGTPPATMTIINNFVARSGFNVGGP